MASSKKTIVEMSLLAVSSALIGLALLSMVTPQGIETQKNPRVGELRMTSEQSQLAFARSGLAEHPEQGSRQ